MDPVHVQPVQSLTPDPRSRARTVVAVAIPVVLFVAFVAAGVLGRTAAGPGTRFAAVETPDPASGPLATPRTPDTAPEDPRPTSASIPTATMGLRVRSVGEILDLRAAGEIGREVVAVAGWLTIPAVGDCALPDGVALSVAERDVLCQRETILADDALPILAVEHRGGLVSLRDPGRHLRPQAIPGVELASVAGRQFMGNSTELRPRRVVIAGRFGDTRLAECRPPATGCDETFAIERVIWVDGEPQVRRTGRYPGLAGMQLSGKVRWHIVDGAMQHGAIVLSEMVVPRDELGRFDPDADRVVPDRVRGTVWYVRTLLRTRSYGSVSGEVGWAVIEDATGFVLAAEPDGRSASVR